MSWPKRIAVALAALALLYGVVSLTVLRGYDDVTLRPFAAPPGLSGGSAEPYAWREGESALVAFHVANDGVVPIRVTGLEPAVHWNVETVDYGLYDGAADIDDLPEFRPFTLGPGQYRDVVVVFRMVHCAPAEAGTTVGTDALRIRYNTLGWGHDRLVGVAGGLRVRFDRALAEPASKPPWCERYARYLAENR